MKSSNLHISQHPSSDYAPRTKDNAESADLTVAFAVDFTTAGERLTKRVADDRYVAIPLESDFRPAARLLTQVISRRKARSLNIAGNGIYTLVKHGWDQEGVNVFVSQVLRRVHRKFTITSVRSGGQTGVDLAGAVAGMIIGVDTSVHMPQGYIMRYENGVDYPHTAQQVRNMVRSGVRFVQRHLEKL